MTEIKIRNAKQEDFKSIVELSNQVLEYHNQMMPHLFASMNKEKQETIYINYWHDPNACFFVADLNNEIIGYLFANFKDTPWYQDSKSCELSEIAVKTGQQNKGVGTKLFNELLRKCKERDVDDIRLNVYLTNTPAIKLYEKLGFKTRSYKMTLALKK